MDTIERYTKLLKEITDNQITELNISINEHINDDIIEKINNSLKVNTSINIIKFSNISFHLIEDNEYDYEVSMYNYYHPEGNIMLHNKYDELKRLYQKYISSIFNAINSNNNINFINVSSILKEKYNKHNIEFNVYDELMPNIINLIKNNHIKKLNLTYNKLTDVKNIFNEIQTNTSLEEINLSNNLITDVDYIYNTLQVNKAIKKINLSNNHIISIKDLDKVIDNNNVLEEINLSCNKIADKVPKSDTFYVSAANESILHDYFNLIPTNNDNNIINNLDQSVFKNNTIKKIDLSFNEIYNTKSTNLNKIILFGTPGFMNNYI